MVQFDAMKDQRTFYKSRKPSLLPS